MPTGDTATVSVDQFVAAPPEKVWRALTEPDPLAGWWVPGDVASVVGHRFHLEMPRWGSIPCEVTVAQPPSRFVHTFNERWTLDWRVVPEGNGTRLLLEHSGFDLENAQDRFPFENMEPGWRNQVVPRLAEFVSTLPE